MSVDRQAHTPDRIAELLVHLGRAARAGEGRCDLTQAQWGCLRFVARANASTRTPSGFAAYQATTRGTASQIIKSLERRGLICRAPSATDRRSVVFDLTEAGQAMLAHDPMHDIVGLIRRIEPAESRRFLRTLSHLVVALAGLRAAPPFGSCTDCNHFSPMPGGGYCGCMAAVMAAEETTRLCASFDPAQPLET